MQASGHIFWPIILISITLIERCYGPHCFSDIKPRSSCAFPHSSVPALMIRSRSKRLDHSRPKTKRNTYKPRLTFSPLAKPLADHCFRSWGILAIHSGGICRGYVRPTMGVQDFHGKTFLSSQLRLTPTRHGQGAERQLLANRIAETLANRMERR